MPIVERLKTIINEYHLLKHPFYQAWSAGTLSQTTLQKYAVEYYFQVESFPRFISRVHSHCPLIDVRKALLANLVDEEIHGTDHPTLWRQFAKGIGASIDEVKHEPAEYETQALVDTFYDLADRDWRDGLCALFAYEYQVPSVSESKIAGLKQFYGISDEKTLEFFTAHQVYDVEHSDQVANLIERYANSQQAEKATHEAAFSLWKFLDGMSRVNECVAAH